MHFTKQIMSLADVVVRRNVNYNIKDHLLLERRKLSKLNIMLICNYKLIHQMVVVVRTQIHLNHDDVELAAKQVIMYEPVKMIEKCLLILILILIK